MKADHARIGFFIEFGKAISESSGVDLSKILKEVLGKDVEKLATAEVVFRAYWQDGYVETKVKSCYKALEMKDMTAKKLLELKHRVTLRNLQTFAILRFNAPNLFPYSHFQFRTK
jgi:hypothetical protein